MKQQVNLYHPSLRPVKPLLTSSRVLSVMTFIFILAVATQLHYKYQDYILGINNKLLTAEQQRLTAHTAELMAKIRAQQPNQRLLNQTYRLEIEVNSHRRLLDEFRQRGNIDELNLTPILYELSEIHQEGLWLTRITVAPLDVSLHGATNKPALIPQWIGKFDDTSTLKEYNFSMVQMKRDANDTLRLVLRSQTNSTQQASR